jgi:hypothetical protein
MRVVAVTENNGFESYVGSATKTVTTTGANGHIIVDIRFPPQMANCTKLLIYQTLTTAAANTQDFYLCKEIDWKKEVRTDYTSAYTVTVGKNPATNIQNNSLDPTLGGFSAQVEMSAGVFSVCESGDRTWFATEDFVIPCLQRTGKQLPQPVPSYAVRVPPTYGRITALASLTSGLVVFTERGIWGITGSPPSYTGEGSSLQLYLIHAGDGAIGPAAVCSTPAGVVFANQGGIYLLTNGRTVENVGQNVRRFFTHVNESTTDVTKFTVAMDVNYTRREVYIYYGSVQFIMNYEVGSWSRSTIVGHPAVCKVGPNTGEMAFGQYVTTATYTYTTAASFTTNVMSFPDPSHISHVRRAYVDGSLPTSIIFEMLSRSSSSISTHTVSNSKRECRFSKPRQSSCRVKVTFTPTTTHTLTDFILYVEPDTAEANANLQ